MDDGHLELSCQQVGQQEHRSLVVPPQARASQSPAECPDVVLVDSDEAGTLLEGFWTKPFYLLQLFSVDERAILLSPLNNIFGSVGIKSCNMPKK